MEQLKGYDITGHGTWRHRGSEVDILIGMSSPQIHKCQIIKEVPNGLTLIKTPFGYFVVGPVPNGTKVNYKDGLIQSNHVSLEYEDIKEETAFKFIEAEMVGLSKECPRLTSTDWN